jgi:hypothetical protein
LRDIGLAFWEKPVSVSVAAVSNVAATILIFVIVSSGDFKSEVSYLENSWLESSGA